MLRLHFRAPNDCWQLVRAAGVFAIVVLMPFRPVVLGLPPGLAERFAPWVGSAPDERWSGCWLWSADAAPEGLRLEIRCPEGRQLVATLTARVPVGATPAPAGDCTDGTSVAPFVSCRMDGTIDERLYPALLSSLRDILSTAMAGVPFVVLPPSDLSLSQWLEEVVEEWWYQNAEIVAGALPLMAFLWLVVTGYFGFASLSRRDWPALVPLVLALIAREALALHSMGEIEPQFHLYSVRNRHSALQWLFSLFVGNLGRDPFAFLMHANGVLGALATLPLYLFVRQRTHSRMAGMLVGAFFAVHPLVARLAPTDNPYSLMLFAWFSGLALLSGPEPGPGPLWAGGCLLGIAAACRPDAFLCVAASLFLLDLGDLLATIRRHPWAAGLATVLVSALLGFHFWFTLPPVMQSGTNLPSHDRIEVNALVRGALGQTELTPWVLAALAPVGALAGVVSRRYRIGLGAVIGAGLLILPYPESYNGGYAVFHRYVPSCAMVALAAGIGAAAVTDLFRRRLSSPVAALPGLAVALYVLGSQTHFLRQTNVIDQEFRMLRDHLAPGGRVKTDCVLLAMSSHPKGDVDIHDFEPILPGLKVSACNRQEEDCHRVALEHSCVYYVRSLSCFYVQNRPPFEPGTSPIDPQAWLDPACRDLERSLDLSPVDERTVYPLQVWQYLDERFRPFPPVATIGLYRVTKVKM